MSRSNKITVSTDGISDIEKATLKFQSAYKAMMAQLTAPGFIPVLCAHEAAHVIYFALAGMKNFDPKPAAIYYDPSIDNYAGRLAAIQILDLPIWTPGKFWEWFPRIAQAHAAGGVVARQLMPTSDGGDRDDKDRFEILCNKLNSDPNVSINVEEQWRNAQDSVILHLKNLEWLPKIEEYAIELRPQLGL
jgi:hypothetical protein